MKFKKNIIKGDRIFWSDETKANVAKSALNFLTANCHKLPACEVIRVAQLCLINKKLRRPDASNTQALNVVKSIMKDLNALGIEMTDDKQLKISPKKATAPQAPEPREASCSPAFAAPYGTSPTVPVKENLRLNATEIFDNAVARITQAYKQSLDSVEKLRTEHCTRIAEIHDTLEGIVRSFAGTGFLAVQAISQKPQGIRIPRILLVGVPPSLRTTVTKKLSVYKDHAQIIFANKMGEVIPAHETVFILTNYGISVGVKQFWKVRSSEADTIAHHNAHGIPALVEGIKSYLNQ